MSIPMRPSMLRSETLVVTVVGGVFLAGCPGSEVTRCTKLVAAKSYDEAARVCEGAFAETQAPAAAAGAIKALWSLQRYDEVLAWEGRIEGTEVEADFRKRAGYVYWLRGDGRRAEEEYEAELALRQEAGDHAGAARSAYQLYSLAWESSRYRAALDYVRLAFEQAAAAGDRPMQSVALHALASLSFDIGDLAGAQRALDASAELSPDEESASPERLVQQGLIRFHEGRPAMARDLFERAAAAAGTGRQASFYRAVHLDLTSAHLALGATEAAQRSLDAARGYTAAEEPEPVSLLYYQSRLDYERGRYAIALASVERALQTDTSPDWRWRLELQRGSCAEKLGRRDAAERSYAASIAVLERLRESLAADELKSWSLNEKRRPYEALFRLQAHAGDVDGALATLERAKARTFLDAFTRAASTRGTSRDQVLEATAHRLDALQSLLPAMTESPSVTQRPVAELLPALRSRAVLVYFAAGDELWLLRWVGGDVGLRRLMASPQEVRRRVERYLARPDPRQAEDLGRLLLPPGSLPPAASTLHLVTDDVLVRLPFAALRLGGRYLVEDHAMTYVPSLNALAALVETGRAPGRKKSEGARVLADPNGDLPAAAHEARAVARGLHVSPRLGEAASVAALLEAADASLLHLATHTGLGPRGASLSLADGEVAASQIIGQRVAPDLVVLASCASAARPQRSKGMWGSLGAAFLVAGSDAVLASLWSIEDEAARRFLLRFYAEGGATSPTLALARTQRSFIADHADPALWAPFVLFGTDPTASGGALTHNPKPFLSRRTK